MQTVKLNLIPGSVLPVVNVSQYDANRQFALQVYDGASAYDLTGKTVTFSNGSQNWDVEVYNEDNNESGFVFQKFDYELSLDDVDAEFAPSKGYSVSIKATDNFSNTAAVSTIITNITVDDRGPVFQDKEDNGYFITDDRPADPETDTLLKGYICWNGAFDGETDVCRYVMQLVDDSGNLLVDRDGKDCMEVIDQTDDPTSVDPVSRSIVTYFAEDLTLDGEYTVLDSNGDKMELLSEKLLRQTNLQATAQLRLS